MSFGKRALAGAGWFGWRLGFRSIPALPEKHRQGIHFAEAFCSHSLRSVWDCSRRNQTF
jgi:hypothetical protein